MKVVLNILTNYQGRVLNISDTADVELRVADRWITRGLAHLPEVKPEPVKTYNEYIQDANLEITFEDLNNIAIFREPSIDVDVIEPIPVDKYVSFDEPKKAKKKLFHR